MGQSGKIHQNNHKYVTGNCKNDSLKILDVQKLPKEHCSHKCKGCEMWKSGEKKCEKGLKKSAEKDKNKGKKVWRKRKKQEKWLKKCQTNWRKCEK